MRRSKPASQNTSGLPLERRFGYRFHMISRALGQHMLSHVARTHGLNIAEYRVMTVLANRQSPSIKDIAAHTDLDKAHVTRALAGLARRGFASQSIDVRDRRLRVVRLTPAGSAVIDELEDYVVARQKRLERRLSRVELATLWKAMAVLTNEIAAMHAEDEEMPPARPRRAATGGAADSASRRAMK